jgi:hypothetical protein
MAKLSYANGTWFLVPLRESGFARGIVARNNGKGIVFGYFFGPKLSSKKDARLPFDLKPKLKILWGRFGHLGLVGKEWPILGLEPDWKEDDWPMPSFVRQDVLRPEIGFMTEYDPIKLVPVSQKKCDPSLVSKYPYDCLMGHGAVELRLTKLLDK